MNLRKLTALLFVAFILAGCSQVIIEPDRFQVNTFLMTSGLDTLYYDKDPNGMFEVGKYEGVPADLKFKFNPLTHTFEAVTDSNSL